ncbi:MAG: DNA-binding protein [Pyrodictiaceae archaeon]
MVEDEKIYLISIKPYFAFQIFRGSKKFELRRWAGSSIEEGAIMVVYASGNVRAIIGEFKVGKVIEGRPEEVWRRILSYPESGVDADDWPYIRGAKRAYALEVREPRLYPRRVSLDEIRSILPGWMPPLSYKLLKEGDPVYELIVKPLRRSLT